MGLIRLPTEDTEEVIKSEEKGKHTLEVTVN